MATDRVATSPNAASPELLDAVSRNAFDIWFILLAWCLLASHLRAWFLPATCLVLAFVSYLPAWLLPATCLNAACWMLHAAGKYLVFFFYPLDFTFVCPTEIVAFSDRIKEFEALNCNVSSIAGQAVAVAATPTQQAHHMA